MGGKISSKTQLQITKSLRGADTAVTQRTHQALWRLCQLPRRPPRFLATSRRPFVREAQPVWIRGLYYTARCRYIQQKTTQSSQNKSLLNVIHSIFIYKGYFQKTKDLALFSIKNKGLCAQKHFSFQFNFLQVRLRQGAVSVTWDHMQFSLTVRTKECQSLFTSNHLYQNSLTIHKKYHLCVCSFKCSGRASVSKQNRTGNLRLTSLTCCLSQ